VEVEITFYFQAIDLWLVASGEITRPPTVDPAHPTVEEQELITRDNTDNSTWGYLGLSMR
jgi:hypothetical protein